MYLGQVWAEYEGNLIKTSSMKDQSKTMEQ